MIKISFKADNIEKAIGPEVEKELQALADTLQSEIKSRTPIDKGRARRGWQQRSQSSSTSVENRVPYIERLEKGYSKQAPRGFVNQSIKATINKRKTS